MRHFPWREMGYAVGFFAIIAGLYIGSYYALVIPTPHVEHSHEFPSHGTPGATFVHQLVAPEFRFGGEHAKAFFGPLHRMDARFRPEIWDRSVVTKEVFHW